MFKSSKTVQGNSFPKKSTLKYSLCTARILHLLFLKTYMRIWF